MGDVDYAVGARINVSGRDLDDSLVDLIQQVCVEQQAGLPAMFSITFHDPYHDLATTLELKPGTPIEIAFEGDGTADDDDPFLKGEVVGQDVDYDGVGSRLIVRGYDGLHHLQRGRRTRTFVNMTDSDIVKQVAEDAGLQVGDLEPTSEVHEHVAQANISDFEFLTARAQATGMELSMVAGKLTFGPPARADQAPDDHDLDDGPDMHHPRHLVFADNLVTFHGRLSASQQVAEVQVRGWDPVEKKVIVGKSLAGTDAAKLDGANPTDFAGAVGDPVVVYLDRPLWSQDEADRMAAAIAERIGSVFVEADGIARGNTELRAGAAVRISNVSDQLSGTYVLSRARHVIDADGYRTQIGISGHENRSLLNLAAAASPARTVMGGGQSSNPRGLARGVVDDNADPEKLGRVKVHFEWLDDQFTTTWAPVMQLGAGPKSGTFFLPAVGDEVIVAFERGSVDRPIVLGGVFNRPDKPPTYGQFLNQGEVHGRGIWSRKGHSITLHDAPDLGGIILEAVDPDDAETMVVSIGLNALDKKLVVQTTGDVEVRADGDISLKGTKITVEADGDLVLKGSTIKLN